jgi:alpha-beta hydrolase superfamily lysophospholipase
MGESMGGALLLVAGAQRYAERPVAEAWVLLAPAVWGRASMGAIPRGALWFASRAVPMMNLSGGNPLTRVTDDEEVLAGMRRDQLLIREIRVDAVSGVVDLMDAAVAAAPAFDPGPVLMLWAGRDDIIPDGATRRFLELLPPAPPALRRAVFDARGYHLLLRDTGRATRASLIGDWLRSALPPYAPTH